MTALLFRKSDLDVRRESPRAKNRGIDIFRTIRCTDDDGHSIVVGEMDEQLTGDLSVLGVRTHSAHIATVKKVFGFVEEDHARTD